MMNENDDQQWLQTVVESFKKRSPETLAALLNALKASDNDAAPLLAPSLLNMLKSLINRRQDGP